MSMVPHIYLDRVVSRWCKSAIGSGCLIRHGWCTKVMRQSIQRLLHTLELCPDMAKDGVAMLPPLHKGIINLEGHAVREVSAGSRQTSHL